MKFGSEVIHTTSCENSLSWARELYFSYKSENKTIPNGLLLLADEHHITRGRQDRTWVTMPGQLLLTYMLRPFLSKAKYPEELKMLFLALSQGLLAGLQEIAPQANLGIKWPNDIYSQDHKVAGLLAQNIFENNKPVVIILGIGINLNNQITPDSTIYNIARSLRDITGTRYDEQEALEIINNNLTKSYQLWESQDYKKIFNLWKAAQLYTDLPIILHIDKQTGKQAVSGFIRDYHPNGDIAFYNRSTERIERYSFQDISLIS